MKPGNWYLRWESKTLPHYNHEKAGYIQWPLTLKGARAFWRARRYWR